ncbi:MAG: ComF family protein [Chitinophagia bacterium]|nr:ComF family protein [Chitinophagia bacterium]
MGYKVNTMINIKRLWINSIAYLFFPELCYGCNKPLIAQEDVLCVACEQAIPLTQYAHAEHNETSERLAGRIPLLYAYSLAYFTDNGIIQHLLHQLKYNNRKEIAHYLGKFAAKRIVDATWATPIHGIIPVPMHPAKEAARGYNQSVLIAEGIASVLNIPVYSNHLYRTRKTESQTKKTRAERAENIKDSFAVKNLIELSGKHLLLVDDVLTTGATLEACAIPLLSEKSIKISLATLAIAIG